tara:strand:- start:191 stop:718 length:528 start_codon:yes stop_codon:yes gene_type:complete
VSVESVEREHIVSMRVENRSGVLARVAGLFSGRGYNIESLTVAPTLDPTISMMTIVTKGDDLIIEQILKQLNKLVEAISVVDLTERAYIDRDMAIIKVKTTLETRAEVFRIAEIFRARVIDSTNTMYTLEVTGTGRKIEAMIYQLESLGIEELVRAGHIAVAREPYGADTDRRSE